MIETPTVGICRRNTLFLALAPLAMAACLCGCGPCRKPELPPDPTALLEDGMTAERVEVPFDDAPPIRIEPDPFSDEAMRARYYDNPPGVETNLVDIPGWTGSRPWGSKFEGRFGERAYFKDNQAVLVRLGRVVNEISRIKPQFEIGYRHETRVQHVEQTEIEGFPVLINYHPIARVGAVEIILHDGWGKIDFTYRNMDVEEVMAFTRNWILQDLDRIIAAWD